MRHSDSKSFFGAWVGMAAAGLLVGLVLGRGLGAEAATPGFQG